MLPELKRGKGKKPTAMVSGMYVGDLRRGLD